ncbi:SET and MYND domain-containing protein 4-like [Aphidius gifuensis]|nr:SET and MYND domain-containing protein 4-like [Aphidius gifuensis]
MDIIKFSTDDMNIARRQYSQKTTFKDKFEVAWNFITPYIKEIRDKINKTVGQSMIWREIGNKEYTTAKNKDYLCKSIEAYTKSIAFAPVGSSELSLAYANRSAVLFRARLYEDCLLDIERSLKAGYPDKLKTKLFLRQSLCLKALKPSSELEPGVSIASAIQWLPDLKKYNPTYDITKEYPKMINDLKEPREIIKFIPEIKNDNAIIVDASDAIELKKTNDNNQHIVATRDIKSGEFIYISEPFAATINDKLRFTNCWHCGRQTWAGVPCDNCPNVIYCSDTCKKKAWASYHNTECLVLGQLLKLDILFNTEKSMTVKFLLKTLNSAGGLLALKKKVDSIDSIKNQGSIFSNGILDVNTIDNFHLLNYHEPKSNMCPLDSALTAVVIVTIFCQNTNILGKKMTLKDLFKSKNKKIFILGELILRYTMIDCYNSQSFVDADNVVWYTALIPFCRIIKPSCDPNVNWTYVGSNVGYYVCKPIKQGELIHGSSFGSYHTSSKLERYFRLRDTCDDAQPCECTACVENWSTIHSLPSYQSMTLSTRIKIELNCMMLKLKEWQKLIQQGDRKELLTIKDDLNRMNDMFHQYITVPCREISELYVSHKMFYSRLRLADDTLN